MQREIVEKRHVAGRGFQNGCAFDGIFFQQFRSGRAGRAFDAAQLVRAGINPQTAHFVGRVGDVNNGRDH